MTRSRAESSSDLAGPALGEVLDVAAFCARPACRREYRRVTQPGNPQRYCSTVCRRAAEKEKRQLRTRLAHFESVVEQTRVDLAAHGRTGDDVEAVLIDVRAAASSAIDRAEGVLRFVRASDDPLADELRLLYDAVKPLMEQ